MIASYFDIVVNYTLVHRIHGIICSSKLLFLLLVIRLYFFCYCLLFMYMILFYCLLLVASYFVIVCYWLLVSFFFVICC